MQLQREQGSDYLVKLRVLTKPVPLGGGDMDESTILNTDSHPGWNVITHSVTSVQVTCWQGYIDLSGYTREDQTWFTRSVQLQGVPFLSASITPTNLGPIYMHDIVSVIPLTDDQLSSLALVSVYPGGMGFAGVTTDIDSQDIIWGRFSRLSQSQAAANGLLRLDGQEFYGTNNGTASDKIYLYRVFANPAILDASQGFTTGPSAFVLSGAVDTEPDLEYIMRLKRSYELAGPYS